MKKAAESPIPPSQALPARSLLAGLWAMVASVAVFFGPDLAQAYELGDQDWEPPVWVASAASHWRTLTRGVGVGMLSQSLGEARDDFYGSFPVIGHVSAPVTPEPQIVEPELLAAAEPPVGDSLSGSGDEASGQEAPVEASANPAPEAPEPPREVAQLDDRLRPTRVLVVGASSIQFELGRELEHAFDAMEDVQVMRFGRHSSGLSRPDYFDWMDKSRELVAEFNPDLVIAQVGGNDCQGMTNEDDSVRARWDDTDNWIQAYGERVEQFIQIYQDGGAQVVIVGMPIMRAPSYRAKMERLNDVTRRASDARGAWYISTWEMTSDDNGEYAESIELDGTSRAFRADDGTHLSLHGAIYVTRELVRILGERYRFVPSTEGE